MKKLLVALSALVGVATQAATLTVSPITGAAYPGGLVRNGDTPDFRWYTDNNAGTVADIRNSVILSSPAGIGSQAFYFRGAGDGSYVNAYFKFLGNLAVNESVSFDVISYWGDGVRGIDFGTLGNYTLGNGLFLSGTATALDATSYQRVFNFKLSALLGNDYTIEVTSKSGPAFSNTRTINTISTIGEIKFYAGALPSNFNTGGQNVGDLDNTGFFVNNFVVIPEPSTPLLMGLGLAGLLALRKNRKA